ncbi:methylenetetrahydrofolate reductase [NAD(P)H] [Hyphomonas sp.]|uniref:methylenetetrahydrofolate reductase [NAD(P)H] n=1 Tax=Hyphomonas sp. TaxID=87 RepID=UPI00391BEED2
MIRRVADAQARTRDVRVSFEFFPPKTEAMHARLWETIQRLEPVQPEFVSVTYGAGGSTRERTHDTVRRIVAETSLLPAGHLTCVSATKEEVLAVAESYWQAGVRHIVALRGDPPAGMGAKFEPHPGGFQDSVDLIRGLREHRPELGKCFEISVSCYPELHPENMGWDAEIAFLKAKQDAGADRAITQFFFEPEVYLRFLEKARAGGVTMPILPGIMLQPNFNGLKRIAGLCGASIPAWLHELYDGLDADEETRDFVTATVAAELCHKLHEEGVEDFHFYTLNRAGLALSTCRLLGVKPPAAEAA